MQRKISIIHPSRGRAEIAFGVYKMWRDRADGEIEYIASWDSDACDEYYRVFFYVDHEIQICLRPNRNAIEAINAAVEYATGDIFIVVSDDFSCPEHWDTLLLQALEGKDDFCVKTKDGLQPTLMTLPIMDRKYYGRFGYIYHPDYIHMYSDQEMTAVAHMIGRNLDVNLIFPHIHYSTGKFAKDAISIRNDKSYAQGRTVFNRRLAKSFDLKKEQIIKPYSAIKWH